MRQLRLTGNPMPPAERAQAQQLLANLQATRPLPLALLEIDEEKFSASLIAIARQYQGRGSSLEVLLTAGYEAAIRAVEIYADQPERLQKWWSWRVRQEMIRVSSQK